MFDAFREIVIADFEFEALPGERQVPVCLVARELRSGRRFRLWQDELLRLKAPPYATGRDVLFVAFYASAEVGCYRSINWPMPERVLDLYVEFRNHTNGLPTPAGAGLLGALAYCGLDGMGVAEKREMQEAIGKGTWRGRFTPEEILEYCEGDVDAASRLFEHSASSIDLPRSLLRGRYAGSAVSAMEWSGTPIDADMLGQLREGWAGIQDRLIVEIDRDYGVFDGRTFKLDRFANWLTAVGIPWPRLETGRLDLADDTFRQMARAYPQVSPLRELRASLSELRLNDLTIGRDGRNRVLLSPFRARSSRNAPSNSKFVFGPSVWLRGLIRPPPGHGVAYIDWCQQEFGVVAALSNDAGMQAAYQSGDPFLAFAKQADAVPADGTKATHGAQRELFKQCTLAVQYGMQADGLARRIGQPLCVARDLLRAHHETYKTFWRWSDAAVDVAMLTGSLHTVFGWTVYIGETPNPRSLRNFVAQGNASEMLRLAACLGTERGVEVCCPIHDAFLICGRLDRLDADIATMCAAMAEASRIVLNGFELRVDVSVTKWPDRYMDRRGAVMWERVCRLLASSLSAAA